MKSKSITRLVTQCIITALIFGVSLHSQAIQAEAGNKPICDGKTKFTMRRLASEQVDDICTAYQGKVMIVVNTASRCGYTDQYDDLEKIYAKYKDKGLVVIGFPSNDFGNQEPGTEESIKDFCRLTYSVEFPMYEKTKVRGRSAAPFYQKLSRAAGQSPAWNFHKYIIDRNGNLAGSYRSRVNPSSTKFVQKIEELL